MMYPITNDVLSIKNNTYNHSACNIITNLTLKEQIVVAPILGRSQTRPSK